jgi:hypothetical protein
VAVPAPATGASPAAPAPGGLADTGSDEPQAVAATAASQSCECPCGGCVVIPRDALTFTHGHPLIELPAQGTTVKVTMHKDPAAAAAAAVAAAAAARANDPVASTPISHTQVTVVFLILVASSFLTQSIGAWVQGSQR